MYTPEQRKKFAENPDIKAYIEKVSESVSNAYKLETLSLEIFFDRRKKKKFCVSVKVDSEAPKGWKEELQNTEGVSLSGTLIEATEEIMEGLRKKYGSYLVFSRYILV